VDRCKMNEKICNGCGVEIEEWWSYCCDCGYHIAANAPPGEEE